MIWNGQPIPEHLPGEPEPRRWNALELALALSQKVLALFAVALVALLVLPFSLPLRLVYGRPPVTPPVGHVLRLMGLSLFGAHPAPGPRLLRRVVLAMSALQEGLRTQIWGFGWLLDELLYGREVAATEIRSPLFEVSAARSGSTQLAHYLEEDPHLITVTVLQSTFPFLWAWRHLAPRLARYFPRERVEQIAQGLFTKEFLQRHEFSPFHTDTFEVQFMMHQLATVSLALGPSVASVDINTSDDDPRSKRIWEDDFIRFLDTMGRKVLLYSPTAPDGTPRRLMVKGHFVRSVGILEQRYPDARFLVMLRLPDKRLQSFVNYIRCNPFDALVGPTPWDWLVELLVNLDQRYLNSELAWLSRPAVGRRCVIPFDDYVRDLEGTMRRVYRECLDQDELPSHVPRKHGPRERTNYLVDRSLAQLGIDGAAYNAQNAAYVALCRGSVPAPART